MQRRRDQNDASTLPPTCSQWTGNKQDGMEWHFFLALPFLRIADKLLYPGGAAMAFIVLFCALLFQAGAQTAAKPAIENERIIVWDVDGSAPAQPLDAVVIYFSGDSA